MKNIIYKRIETTEELQQILELQELNLSTSISDQEKKKEGFVTVHHTFEILKLMNNKCAHIIAKSNNRVVGYALCMAKDFKDEIDVLKPMFDNIEDNIRKGIKYIVMGQICIDKSYRKQGVFKSLYSRMKEILKHKYDCIVTEVDSKNERSLGAHLSIGFKILYSYSFNNQDWKILSWNIKEVS
ncbi:GNAT family N-acetyltransferase [Flavivirga aquatica]|uniref:GNAT family N-acetyltransferase n=1 Tax=Flavivirga aquatica TaxID=1849968 RepID=A0A1E5TDD8_9FLAO|nr:GNAT family N-acetyltransferase [Flavivirga aquatica]OEK09393.1 GNAT family N-acetyltransferase [Flavivirga aquatica]